MTPKLECTQCDRSVELPVDGMVADIRVATGWLYNNLTGWVCSESCYADAFTKLTRDRADDHQE